MRVFSRGTFLSRIPRAWLYRCVLVAMLAAFILLELSLLNRRSMMVDDVIHMPAGYSYLKTHDFRLNAEHPLFIKLLSAIGLEHTQPELPLDSEGWSQAEEPGDPDDGTNTFCGDFFHRNADKFEQIVYWGRVPVIFVPVLLALAVWAFARNLFGDFTSILAVLFLLTEPTLIANSTFVQDDIAAALAVFCFVLALRGYFRKPVFVRSLFLGLAIGFGLLVKHSLVVLVPIAIVLLTSHAIWRKYSYKEHFCRYIGFGLVILGFAYFIFIAGYGFDVNFIDDDESVFISEWFNGGEASESLQNVFVHLPVLLPKYYLWGMDLVVNDLRNGRISFLFGQVSDRGWWYYFPAAFVLKTTLPFLLLTLSGLVWTIWKTLRTRWVDGVYLILPPLLYLGLCTASHLNIGVRHIMPVFPFFAIIGAFAVSESLKLGRLKNRHLSHLLAGLLAAWVVWIAIAAFPNYTTYFSPLAGGPANGRHLLSDSNIETGQDVNSLAAFMKGRGEDHIEGLFFGSGYIEYYGVRNCELPCAADSDNTVEETDDGDDNDNDTAQEQPSEPNQPQEPAKYIAIGAYYLEEIDLTPEQKAIIHPYRSMQPEAVINNAIFVYHKLPDQK